MTSDSDPRRAFEPSEADRRWQARVDAAKREVAEAQAKVLKAESAAEQAWLYRELEAKQRAVEAAMLNKWG
jgi:hypothetical protein